MFWAKLILVEIGPYISIALLNMALVIVQLNLYSDQSYLAPQILAVRKSSRAHPRTEDAARKVRQIRGVVMILCIFIYILRFVLYCIEGIRKD